MTVNTAIWDALYKSDPDHVKKITGKSYQGDSPKPQWVVKRLTEQFGPVGKGFGWEVLESKYIASVPRPDGVEQRHECRIRFWWVDGEIRRDVESFGGTKSLYKAKGDDGYWVDDEDAAKKSLTDAITKAASWLGLAGDIFMGQWNDSVYVNELKAEKNGPPAAPKLTHKDPAMQAPTPFELFLSHMDRAKSLTELHDVWSSHVALQTIPAAIKAKDRNKARLKPTDLRGQLEQSVALGELGR